MCTHLFLDGPRGLNGTDPDDDGIVEAMWCDTCEGVYLDEKGQWNDRVMDTMDLRLICHRCFAEVRRSHFELLSPSRLA